MIDPMYLIASLFCIFAAAIIQPERAQCPPRWHNEGVRPSGSFVCRPNPIGDDHRDARGFLVDDSVQPPGELRGALWCTSGQLPIVVDDRVVGCQRTGWR